MGARLEGNSAAPLRAKLVPTGTSQAKASSVVVVVIGAVAAERMLRYYLELWGFMTATKDVSLLHFYFYLANNATTVRYLSVS